MQTTQSQKAEVDRKKKRVLARESGKGADRGQKDGCAIRSKIKRGTMSNGKKIPDSFMVRRAMEAEKVTWGPGGSQIGRKKCQSAQSLDERSRWIDGTKKPLPKTVGTRDHE